MIPRLFAVIAALLVGGATLVVFLKSPETKPLPAPESSLVTGSALSNDTVLEKAEFQPVLDQAFAELGRRYSSYESLRWWSKAIGYCGLVLTSLLTLLAGFYGFQGTTAPTQMQQLIDEQKLSKGLTRLVGILIAFTTLPGAVSQRLDTDAAAIAASGRELWQAISGAEQKLVDPNAATAEARSLLFKVQEATIRTW